MKHKQAYTFCLFKVITLTTSIYSNKKNISQNSQLPEWCQPDIRENVLQSVHQTDQLLKLTLNKPFFCRLLQYACTKQGSGKRVVGLNLLQDSFSKNFYQVFLLPPEDQRAAKSK